MTLRRLASLGTALAVLVVLAGPAWSARVVEVRVGNHPQFTRVVFELDAPAGYRIERRQAGGEHELVIELSAASVPREVKSRSPMVEKIAIEQSGANSVARVQLRREAPLVKEMILGAPPRIVLDFMLSDEIAREVAASVQPKPASGSAGAAPVKVAKADEPEAAAPPKPAVEKPKPEAAAPPKPAVEAPKPEAAAPPKVAVEKPKPEAAAPPKPEAAAPPKVAVEKPKPEVAPLPTQEPSREAPLAGVDRALEGERIVQPKVERSDLPEQAAAAPPAAAPSEPAVERAKPPAPKTAKPPALPAPSRPEAEPAGPFGLKLDGADPWLTLGLVGGGLVVFLIVVTMLLRRQSKPTSLDALEMAREIGEPVGSADAFETIAEAGAETERRGAFPVAGPGSFEDERDKGGSDMDVAAEHTIERGARGPMMAGAMGSATDVGAMVQELERRMAQLERRLEEANEARERLERQVTAQSEELRVQRAAIARTQRALRGMTRTGEDQATEPALRDPSKPTSGRG
jgi:hypothetical protein